MKIGAKACMITGEKDRLLKQGSSRVRQKSRSWRQIAEQVTTRGVQVRPQIYNHNIPTYYQVFYFKQTDHTVIYIIIPKHGYLLTRGQSKKYQDFKRKEKDKCQFRTSLQEGICKYNIQQLDSTIFDWFDFTHYAKQTSALHLYNSSSESYYQLNIPASIIDRPPNLGKTFFRQKL